MKWFNVRNVGGLLKNKMLVKKDVYLNPRQSSDVFVVSNVNYYACTMSLHANKWIISRGMLSRRFRKGALFIDGCCVYVRAHVDRKYL